MLIVLTVVAYANGYTAILYPLYAASLSAVGYLAATAKAAPIMWSLRTAQDEEQVVKQKLDLFAFWHIWRTAFQLLAFGALLWALASGLRSHL
jgi:hypothetical protein